MLMSDWFDPQNVEHLKAYKHLCKTGTWPAHFLPNNIEIKPLCSTLIRSKLADEWVKHKLETTG